jgi:hypothetical protein
MPRSPTTTAIHNDHREIGVRISLLGVEEKVHSTFSSTPVNQYQSGQAIRRQAFPLLHLDKAWNWLDAGSGTAHHRDSIFPIQAVDPHHAAVGF